MDWKFILTEKLHWLFLVIIICVTGIIYYPSLFGEFILDDNTYFFYNDKLTKLTAFDVFSVFLNPSNYWGEFLPVRDYLFVLEYNGFGEWTRGYHIVSLSLFFLSALSLFYFVRILFKDYDKKRKQFSFVSACFVMTLFLFNPMNVEAVAWISGQKDLLALLFTIMSLILMHRAGRSPTQRIWFAFIGGVLCYYLGLLSKFSILPLVVFIPILWLYTSDLKWKFLLKHMIFWFLAQIPVVLWLFYNFTLTEGLNQQTNTITFLERIPRALNILGIHISHIFWPANLSFGYFYGWTWHLNVYFFVGLTYIMVIILLLLKKRSSYITMGLLFFGLFLIPVLQIYPEMPNMHIYNRYLTIPLIGMFIALTALIHLYDSVSKQIKISLIVVFMWVVVCWGYITSKQIKTFHSNLAITENIFRVHPNWSDALYKYVSVLIFENQLEYAKFLIHNQKVFHEWSGFKELFLGKISIKQENWEEARKLLEIASVKETKAGLFPKANFELAKILILQGDYILARDLLKEQLVHPERNMAELGESRDLLKYIERKISDLGLE